MRIGLNADRPVFEWDDFLSEFRQKVQDTEAVDELAALDCSWYGVDLFEIRTFAEVARSGMLHVTTLSKAVTGQITDVLLEPCRQKGSLLSLPNDLDQFVSAAERFARKLLHLSNRIKLDNLGNNENPD